MTYKVEISKKEEDDTEVNITLSFRSRKEAHRDLDVIINLLFSSGVLNDI